MELFRKKNEATEICFPLINEADYDHFVSGESPTDTAYYHDGGSWTSLPISDTITEIGSTGIYQLSLLQTEMNHDLIMIKVTATNAVDDCIIIRTREVDVDDLVRSTTPANTLDISANGCAGIDWNNIDTPGATVDLSATTIDSCDGVTGAVGSVTNVTNITDNPLTVDGSGRVDVGEWLGTAVTINGTTSKPEVDVYGISGSATAANNVETVFDTDFGNNYNAVDNYWRVDVAQWDDEPVETPNEIGVPIVDLGYVGGIGTTVTNLNTVFNTDFASNYDVTNDRWLVDSVAISGSITAADNVEANISNLDATVSSRGTSTLTQTQVTGGAYSLDTDANGRIRLVSGAGTGEISLSSGEVTVGTNNDKTGYSISGTKNTLDDLNDIDGSSVTLADGAHGGSSASLTLSSYTNFHATTVTTVTGNVNGSVGSVANVSNIVTNPLDVTATGAAGIDWGNVENQGSVVNLSGTNIDVDQVVASVSGNVDGDVTGSVGSISGVTFPTNFGSMNIDADGVVHSDLQEILGNDLVESNSIAAGLAYFFDVASPSKTMEDVGGSGATPAQIWDYDISGITGVGYAGNYLNNLTDARAGYIDNLSGHVAQSGDSYSIVNNGTYGNAQLVRATTPANTLDISAAGCAGIDWANIDAPTTAQNLSGTNIDVDQVVASVSGNVDGNVGSVVGNVGGNVTGSVGSISGVTFPTNFADLAITATSGRVDVGSWLGTAVTVSSGTSLPEVDAKSISDSTAAADNVEANISNLDAAISTRSTLTQAQVTGGAYALDTDANGAIRIVDGTGAREINTNAGAIVSVTTVTGNVEGSIGSLAAQAKTDVNNEVVDVIDTDTSGEPGQGAPPVSTDLRNKIDYLYKFTRNKVTNDGSTIEVYNDAGDTVDQKSSVSSAGGTVTRGEFSSGP